MICPCVALIGAAARSEDPQRPSCCGGENGPRGYLVPTGLPSRPVRFTKVRDEGWPSLGRRGLRLARQCLRDSRAICSKAIQRRVTLLSGTEGAGVAITSLSGHKPRLWRGRDPFRVRKHDDRLTFLVHLPLRLRIHRPPEQLSGEAGGYTLPCDELRPRNCAAQALAHRGDFRDQPRFTCLMCSPAFWRQAECERPSQS